MRLAHADSAEEAAARAIFGRGPFLPVVEIADAAQAVPLARALVAGGIAVIEVTLRSPAALPAIAAIAAAVPEMIVGLGTLRTAEDIARAQAAGARFVVSPGWEDGLAAAARKAEMVYLPGVMTPSEIMRAASAGHRLLKFFPAEAAGGVRALEALAGPFADIAFCPTGGIIEANMAAYLACPNVVCVGGSWVAPAAAIAAGDWAAITERARRAAGHGPGGAGGRFSS